MGWNPQRLRYWGSCSGLRSPVDCNLRGGGALHGKWTLVCWIFFNNCLKVYYVCTTSNNYRSLWFFFFFNLLPRTVCLGKSNSVIYSLNCFFLYLYCVWGFITGQSKTPWRRSSLKSIVICELAEQGKEHQSQVVVSCGVTDTWNKPIFGVYRFYKVFFWAIFQVPLLFCIGQGFLLKTKHFISQWWIISQWVIPVKPVIVCRCWEPSFTSLCCSPRLLSE